MPETYTVYVLKSTSRNYLYVGMTNNLKRRIKQHQQGEQCTTKPYRPFALLLIETYKTRIEARTREKQLKSGYGKEYLKALV